MAPPSKKVAHPHQMIEIVKGLKVTVFHAPYPRIHNAEAATNIKQTMEAGAPISKPFDHTAIIQRMNNPSSNTIYELIFYFLPAILSMFPIGVSFRLKQGFQINLLTLLQQHAS